MEGIQIHLSFRYMHEICMKVNVFLDITRAGYCCQ
jgi:hypothetical protein